MRGGTKYKLFYMLNDISARPESADERQRWASIMALGLALVYLYVRL